MSARKPWKLHQPLLLAVAIPSTRWPSCAAFQARGRCNAPFLAGSLALPHGVRAEGKHRYARAGHTPPQRTRASFVMCALVLVGRLTQLLPRPWKSVLRTGCQSVSATAKVPMLEHDPEDAWHSPLIRQPMYVAQTAGTKSYVCQGVSRASLACRFNQCDRVPSLNRRALRRRLPRTPNGDPEELVPGTIVWLRHFDLRLHDHPALSHAARRGRPVHVVFAWSPAEDAAQGQWKLAGTAFALWLHHALVAFDRSLRRRYGLSVAVRTGEG